MEQLIREQLDYNAGLLEGSVHSLGFTSNNLGMDMLNGEDIKVHCLRTLAEVGAPAELSNFYAEVLQCEYDMTRTVYWLYNDLTTRAAKQQSDSFQPAELFGALQNMTKYFRGWKAKVDNLSQQRLSIPPFQVSPSSLSESSVLHAVCDFETDQVNLREGDEMVITDASRPDWLRIRNSSGEEGYVPALSCIIPTPDNSALTAVERLQILLLTSWAECLRKIRSILIATLTASTRQLASRWKTWLNGRRYNGQIGVGLQKVIDLTSTLETVDSKELTRLHRYLCHIESELLGFTGPAGPTNGLSVIKENIANLDKSVLCFQTFYVQWRHFRRELQKAPRPIRIVEQWEKLRRASQCSNFKYYELKMVLDEVETVEEITHVEPQNGTIVSSAQRSKLETVESEDKTTVSQEVRKRYVIKSVVDPATGAELTLRQAVSSGVIDYKQGLYVTNPDTGQGIPLSEAMTSGAIVIDYCYVRRSPPVTDVVSLITVRRRIIDHAYTLTGAIDATTAERVDCLQAIQRGVLDLTEGEYVNGHTGARLPLDEAIERGWVFAEFDDDNGRRAPRYSSSTHAVLGVVDRRSGRLLPLTEAIRRGLVDPRTGDFIDNRTGRRVYVAEAIRQGLIKTRIVEQSTGDDTGTSGISSPDSSLPWTTPSGSGCPVRLPTDVAELLERKAAGQFGGGLDGSQIVACWPAVA